MKSAKEKQFEELVKQYKRTIYSVCYMFSRDNEEINDLFQEILVRLWLGFDQFENRSSVNTWVYRIALNTAINSNKRAKRRPQTVPLSTDIDPYDPQDSSTRAAVVGGHRLRRNCGHYGHHGCQCRHKTAPYQGKIGSEIKIRHPLILYHYDNRKSKPRNGAG